MIHVNHIDLTPAIRTHVESKIGGLTKLLSAKQNELAEARVEIGRPSQHHHSGDVYSAEVNLKIGGELFRAEAEHEDLHVAINMTQDEIERQLLKLKTKVQASRRQLKKQ